MVELRRSIFFGFCIGVSAGASPVLTSGMGYTSAVDSIVECRRAILTLLRKRESRTAVSSSSTAPGCESGGGFVEESTHSSWAWLCAPLAATTSTSEELLSLISARFEARETAILVLVVVDWVVSRELLHAPVLLRQLFLQTSSVSLVHRLNPFAGQGFAGSARRTCAHFRPVTSVDRPFFSQFVKLPQLKQQLEKHFQNLKYCALCNLTSQQHQVLSSSAGMLTCAWSPLWGLVECRRASVECRTTQ
jgi:hypothetical protein